MNATDFLRRVAPAAAVTGGAIALVGLLDPALGGTAVPVPVAATQTSSGSSTTSGATGTGTSPSSTDGAAGPEAPACAAPDQVAGDTVQTRFGPVQVSAGVDGTTLCSVQAVAWPSGDPQSARISAFAIPLLDQQASSAGAGLQGVSGATYTSQGYRQSLQSILDQL